MLITIKKNGNSIPDQSNSQSGSAPPAKVATGAEFKERAAFNRRRGAMRRRVHQVNNFLCIFIKKTKFVIHILG